jgi:hypothetical protein
MEKILIYKTNINSERKLKLLEKCFAKYKYIEKWNVDLIDCDCVLRIIINDVYSFEKISKMPSFFINGIKYNGSWEKNELLRTLNNIKNYQ